MKMNIFEGEEKERKLMEANVLFWIERLLLFLVVIFPTYLVDLIIPFIFATTLFSFPLFVFCPNLSSVGPSGIGGIWLFILDHSTFYLVFEYYKLLAEGFELIFLWRFTVWLSFVIHSIYIVDYFCRFLWIIPDPPQSKNHETPDEGNVSKQVEELAEDGKKMMTYMENMVHSGFETQRKEWGEFLDELSKDRKMMMTKLDGMICSQLGTLKDSMRFNVDEIWKKLREELRSKVDEDVKALRQDLNNDVRSMADQLQGTFIALQETIKEVKAHETYLIEQTKRQVIRGENVEGFAELREQVWQMAEEAEIVAEKLSRVGELVDAGIQQWEEDNFDYLASLPLTYLNRNP